MLSRLFWHLFLDLLLSLHQAGGLAFYGDLAHFARADAFTDWLVPFRKSGWVVYSKPPFGGPEARARLRADSHRCCVVHIST
ncbi:MAG: hypothetical protein ACJAQW_000212 [Paracoccaceae bacterium]